MKKEHNEVFQQRIDELLAMEKKAERRAGKLVQQNEDFQKKMDKTVDRLEKQSSTISLYSHRLKEADDKIEHRVNLTIKYSIWFIGGYLIISLLFGFGCWYGTKKLRDIKAELNYAKAELSYLESKIENIPKTVLYNGANMIRVIPGTEQKLYINNKCIGTYSEMWGKK
jgi:prefoldin subunit 5